MEQVIVKLPDWRNPTVNNQTINLADVESLKIIGDSDIPLNSFSRMPNLKSVEISDEVTGIGQDAFYQCPVLEYVSIGKGVKYIGDSAFSICKALRQIEIPGNVRKIGVHAFFGCSHIQKVVLHEGIESIGNMAFSVCTDLEEIIFPNSIKCVEGYVFDKSKWQAAHTEDFVILGKTLFYYNGAEYHSIRVPEGIEVIAPPIKT